MPIPKGYKQSDEARKHDSESKMGIKNPMYGTHHSEETKRKLSAATKGKPKSAETIQRMKEAHKNDPGPPKGRKMSQQARENMSKGRKGMKFSDEHCRHLSEAHRGQIVSAEARQKRSEYNKSHPEVIERLGVNRANNLSVQQMNLYKIIESLYPNDRIEPEWKVETEDGIKFIDVAIPSRLLGWEYNNPFWHREPEKDKYRQELIEALGWKLECYSDVSEFTKIKKN